jgi:hypothetical protein
MYASLPISKQRFRRKLRGFLGIAWALISIYIGTYAAFYHRGVNEAERYHSFYFYVPMQEVMTSPEIPRRHYILMMIFRPINGIHREYLGGRSPCICILRGFGQPIDDGEERNDIDP